MLPGIRPRLFSLAEFYQLKDIKSVKNTAKLAKQWNFVLGNTLSNKKYAAQITRLIAKKLPLAKALLVLPADVYLQWKFNIQPLLGDIAAVKASYTTVASEIDKLIQNLNKPQIRHHSSDLSGIYKDVSSTFNDTRGVALNSIPPEGSYSVKNNTFQYNPSGISLIVTKDVRKAHYDSCSFHAAMQYSYSLGPFERENLAHLARLDSLGIGTNPVKELWELIPWSFVVDWIFDVSQYLDNLESKHVKPVTSIHNWCWSQSVSRRTEIFTTFKSSYPDAEVAYNVPDVLTRIVSETAYKRGTDGLNVNSAIIGSGISSSEFILASALAVTRKPHRRKR
jgi:hypothetical protein